MTFLGTGGWTGWSPELFPSPNYLWFCDSMSFPTKPFFDFRILYSRNITNKTSIKYHNSALAQWFCNCHYKFRGFTAFIQLLPITLFFCHNKGFVFPRWTLQRFSSDPFILWSWQRSHRRLPSAFKGLGYDWNVKEDNFSLKECAVMAQWKKKKKVLSKLIHCENMILKYKSFCISQLQSKTREIS